MKEKFLIFFTIIPIFVFGQQETIQRKIKSHNAQSLEKFYVLKSDKNVRHGEYKRYWGAKLVTLGNYNNSQKQVFKYFYYSDKPSLIYNYSTNEIVEYSKEDCFDKVYSETGKELVVDRPPIPLFSRYELGWFISSNIKYPDYAKEIGLSERIEILVTINEEGEIVNYRLFHGIHKTLIEESLRVIKSLPKDWKWLPAEKDGIKIKSSIVFPFNFIVY
jgi:hypothetical protein